MTLLATVAIRAYQVLISPFLEPRCKYHPSCSQYALDALREYGFARGIVLAAWRLLRCNPWSHGGVDYVSDQTLFPARPGKARSRRPGGPATRGDAAA